MLVKESNSARLGFQEPNSPPCTYHDQPLDEKPQYMFENSVSNRPGFQTPNRIHSSDSQPPLVVIKLTMHRTQDMHGAVTDMAVSTSTHAWSPTQAAWIVQPLKARQVADEGWQLPGELIVPHTTAYHDV